MVDYILSFGYAILHMVEGFDRRQWTFLFCAMVLFGVFCMRGFGSRAHY